MKNWYKSYLYFSAIEKTGIYVFVSILLLVLTAFITMPLFIKSPDNFTTDTTLLAAWNDYKLAHSNTDEHTDKNITFTGVTLFAFDPNILDSNGFIKLGLKPITTHFLLNWRRKGKVFYKKEDFKDLFTLSEEQYNQLAPYIVVGQKGIVPEDTYKKHSHTYQYLPEPDHIDINTTDSATLVRLKGIGPFYAHKLIERRNALGGFIRQEQLYEVYKFPDTTLQKLKDKLVINPNEVRKIHLNTATVEQLQAHPYIAEKTAKNIILYRDAIKRFEKIEQLRQVPLMNEEIYRKIAPYLSIQ